MSDNRGQLPSNVDIHTLQNHRYQYSRTVKFHNINGYTYLKILEHQPGNKKDIKDQKQPILDRERQHQPKFFGKNIIIGKSNIEMF